MTIRDPRAVVAAIAGACLLVALGADALTPSEPPMCAAALPGFGWPGAVSNTLIALAYIGIPAECLRVARRDPRARWLAVAFSAFIVSCGFGHLLMAAGYAGWMLPAAELRAVDKLTAVVSLAVLGLFHRWVSGLDAQPSPWDRITDGAPVSLAVVVIDRDGLILSVSEGAKALHGLPGDVVGHDVREVWHRTWTPYYDATVWPAQRATLDAGEVVEGVDPHFVKPDGTHAALRYRSRAWYVARPLSDMAGGVGGYIFASELAAVPRSESRLPDWDGVHALIDRIASEGAP